MNQKIQNGFGEDTVLFAKQTNRVLGDLYKFGVMRQVSIVEAGGKEGSQRGREGNHTFQKGFPGQRRFGHASIGLYRGQTLE